MCNQIVKWGVAYFFKPVSMEVWPLQMPWVATLTTPALPEREQLWTNQRREAHRIVEENH
jgi:hypothetical protein